MRINQSLYFKVGSADLMRRVPVKIFISTIYILFSRVDYGHEHLVSKTCKMLFCGEKYPPLDSFKIKLALKQTRHRTLIKHFVVRQCLIPGEKCNLMPFSPVEDLCSEMLSLSTIVLPERS